MSVANSEDKEIQQIIDGIQCVGNLGACALDDIRFLKKWAETHNPGNRGVQKHLEKGIKTLETGGKITPVGKQFKVRKNNVDDQAEEDEEITEEENVSEKIMKPAKAEEEIVPEKKGKGRAMDHNAFVKKQDAKKRHAVVYIPCPERPVKKSDENEQAKRKDMYFEPKNLIKVAELVYEEGEQRNKFISGVSNVMVKLQGSDKAFDYIKTFRTELACWCRTEEASIEFGIDADLKDFQKKHCEVYRRFLETGSIYEEPVSENTVVEEPVSENTVVEEPVSEEKPAEEPVSEEKPAEEPVSENTVVEEPKKLRKRRVRRAHKGPRNVSKEPVSEEKPAEEPVSEEKPAGIPLERIVKTKSDEPVAKKSAARKRRPRKFSKYEESEEFKKESEFINANISALASAFDYLI